jgi:hypothetical protein
MRAEWRGKKVLSSGVAEFVSENLLLEQLNKFLLVRTNYFGR